MTRRSQGLGLVLLSSPHPSRCCCACEEVESVACRVLETGRGVFAAFPRQGARCQVQGLAGTREQEPSTGAKGAGVLWGAARVQGQGQGRGMVLCVAWCRRTCEPWVRDREGNRGFVLDCEALAKRPRARSWCCACGIAMAKEERRNRSTGARELCVVPSGVKPPWPLPGPAAAREETGVRGWEDAGREGASRQGQCLAEKKSETRSNGGQGHALCAGEVGAKGVSAVRRCVLQTTKAKSLAARKTKPETEPWPGNGHALAWSPGPRENNVFFFFFAFVIKLQI